MLGFSGLLGNKAFDVFALHAIVNSVRGTDVVAWGVVIDLGTRGPAILLMLPRKDLLVIIYNCQNQKPVRLV